MASACPENLIGQSGGLCRAGPPQAVAAASRAARARRTTLLSPGRSQRPLVSRGAAEGAADPKRRLRDPSEVAADPVEAPASDRRVAKQEGTRRAEIERVFERARQELGAQYQSCAPTAPDTWYRDRSRWTAKPGSRLADETKRRLLPDLKRRVSSRSQAHDSGRVRRTNDRFTLKTRAPDFRRPFIDPIGHNTQPAPPPDVVVGESPDHHRLWLLAGEEGFEPSIS